MSTKAILGAFLVFRRLSLEWTGTNLMIVGTRGFPRPSRSRVSPSSGTPTRRGEMKRLGFEQPELGALYSAIPGSLAGLPGTPPPSRHYPN